MRTAELDRLAGAFEHSATGVALMDPEGVWLEVNPAFCHMVGRERDELVGTHFRTITHPDDLDHSLKQLRRLNEGELSSFRFDKRYVHAEGREVWVRLDVSMVRDDQGGPDFIISQAQDITVSRQIRQALADSEARIQSIVTSMGEGLMAFDPDGRLVLHNERAAQILGLSADDRVALALFERDWRCFHPDGSVFPKADFPVASTLRDGTSRREVTMGLERADGTVVWIEINAEPIREDSGVILGAVATFSDVTERLRTEQALKESEQRLSLALEGARLAMWDWHPASGELHFSHQALKMLGYRDGEVESSIRSVLDLLYTADRAGVIERMEGHLRGQSALFEVDARMRRKSGGYVWIMLRGRVTERDGQDCPRRVSGTFMDITQWKRLQDQLVQMATTDPLTGLYNRRHAGEQLERECERARRTGQPFSVILLDLDHFKEVNDRLGHDAGDRVLEQVAEMIRGRLRRTDLAARWGGEEFALILPDTARAAAEGVAGKLLEAMRGLTGVVDGGISASFGVTESRGEESVEEILKRADRLMYRAKDAGRGRVESG